MASLTGNQINNTYTGLLKFTDNLGVTGTPKDVTDGLGAGLPMAIASNRINFTDTIDFSAATVLGLPGGSAGLVSGSEPNSMISDASLTTNPAVIINDGDIALGENAVHSTTTANLYAIGGAVAIGKDSLVRKTVDYSFADSVGGIAIGYSSEAIDGIPSSGGGAVAIGTEGRATGMGSIALGKSQATADQDIAFGQSASASGTRSIAAGSQAQATNYSAVAIGHATRASGGGFQNGSTSIGAFAETFNVRSVYIGVNGSVQVDGGIAIGQGIDIQGTGANAIVIGNNTSTPSGQNAQDAIFIGSGMSIANDSFNTIAMGLVANVEHYRFSTRCDSSWCICRSYSTRSNSSWLRRSR